MTALIIITLVLLFVTGIYMGIRQEAARKRRLDLISDQVASRMQELNAAQPYQPEVTAIDTGNSVYEDSGDYPEAETERGLAVMTQLTTVLDIADPEQPLYYPQNLDLYFDSWRILRLTNFEGTLDQQSHFYLLHLAFGKYCCEKHGFTWKHKTAGTTPQLILLHSPAQIELSPIASILRCLSRNEIDAFTALEQAFLTCLEENMKSVRIE